MYACGDMCSKEQLLEQLRYFFKYVHVHMQTKVQHFLMLCHLFTLEPAVHVSGACYAGIKRGIIYPLKFQETTGVRRESC